LIDGLSVEYLIHLNEKYRIFSQLINEEEFLRIKGRCHFHFSAKDNLCTTDFQSRAGSRILDGYKPPFDATAVRKLRESGGLLIGKTNMDEFGFGTFCTNSAYGVPRNPFDTERSCGGSSGGAAAAVALLDGHVALAVSTGGSISCPASFCGVIGMTPTYGRVSRHGLIDYSNSLDKIGLMCRSASDVRKYLPIISGIDPLDPTSCAQPPLDLSSSEIRKICIPREAMQGISDEVEVAFRKAIEVIEDGLNIVVEEVNMPSLRFALPAYYVLATSEASTNLARYSGMRFGIVKEDVSTHFNTFFSEVRSVFFGKEAKRRILLGTYCRRIGFRDRYYLKALSVRQIVKEEYLRVFQDFDLVVMPTMPFIAPRFSDIQKMKPLDMYKADFLTVPPNLVGLPHISLPCGYYHGMPIGFQLVAPHWEENRLLHFAERWESVFQYQFPEVKL
jgi:aspartyl-tRNA(Asn)/glutamyl-tRNA(Gln) amidotransferase subunit A